MTTDPDTQVLDQIRTIAEQQLSPDYFEETTGGDAETAVRKRITRDDRYLLVCEGDQTVRVVDSVDYLSRNIGVVGFSFFGSYTAEEIDVAVVCLRVNDGVGTPGLVEAFGAQKVAEYGTEYAERWGCSVCDDGCDCQWAFYKMTETTDPDA